MISAFLIKWKEKEEFYNVSEFLFFIFIFFDRLGSAVFEVRKWLD